MKNITAVITLLLIMSSCKKDLQQKITTATCNEQENINAQYSKADNLQKILDKYAKEGIPGIVLAVYSEKEGWWGGTAGYAKIEDKTPMQLCHLQYLQSVAKTYMATAILKLKEQGKIVLDEPITTYLPARYSSYVPEAEKITVRMLLNHTSGIPDYSMAPKYTTYLLQHPEHSFSSEDYLSFIDKKLEFTPGSKYKYRNVNYLLLALIADHITGDHAKYIQKEILDPLQLTNTKYKDTPGYLNYPNLVNSYWDRHGDGVIENVTRMQQVNVASLIGDDGIVATPFDAVKFLRALMEGKILSAASMQEMKTFVKNEQGEDIYGLGLYSHKRQGHIIYGHGGAGIGGGCGLRYFSDKGVYMFLGANLGVVLDVGPLVAKAGQMQDEIVKILLDIE